MITHHGKEPGHHDMGTDELEAERPTGGPTSRDRTWRRPAAGGSRRLRKAGAGASTHIDRGVKVFGVPRTSMRVDSRRRRQALRDDSMTMLSTPQEWRRTGHP